MTVPLQAQAVPDQPAYQAAIDEALNEYELQHYAEARSLFAKAHALAPSARTWRSLGMMEFELRNYPACIEDLERALASPVKPLDDALRADAEALLRRAREFAARVFVTLRPPIAGATFRLDGTPCELGATGLLVSVGEHRLEVSAEGYRTELRQLHLVGGQEENVLVLLSPTTQDAAASTSQSDGRPLYKSPWLWSSVAVAVVGAVALGTALGLRKDPEPRLTKGDPEVGGGLVQTLSVSP